MHTLLIAAFSLCMTTAKPHKTAVDFKIEGQAKSKTYGYSPKNPVKVGGGASAGHHFMFIQHLRGKNGEKLSVKRLKSCCEYANPDTSLTHFDKGVLTAFNVSYSGMAKSKTLYFDKYRNDKLYIPAGLSWVE